MKTNPVSLSFLVALLLVPVSQAAEVDTPHEFSAGTAAVASEVNENFTVLEGGINDNAQQISDLINTIDTLESENQNLLSILNNLVFSKALHPSVDTYLNLNDDTTPHSDSSVLEVADTDFLNYYSLLKFDFSDIPSEATILSAELRLWKSQAESSGSPIDKEVCLQRVLSDWDAAVVPPTAPLLDSTCLSSDWIPRHLAGFYYWHDLDALVQAWLDGEDNFGVALVVTSVESELDPSGLEFSGHSTSFYSNEGQYKPELVVRYQLQQ